MKWYLKRGWEILHLNDRLLIRSATESFTLRDEESGSQLTRILTTLEEGASIEEIEHATNFDPENLQCFINALNSLGLITTKVTDKRPHIQRSITLKEAVNARKVSRRKVTALPESGGINHARELFNQLTEQSWLVYGVRVDDSYYLVQTDGAPWLHPDEVFHRLFRSRISEEEIPYIWHFYEEAWPSKVPYYTDTEVITLADQIAHLVHEEKVGVWRLDKGGATEDLTARFTPHSADVKNLETHFVGPEKIVAECNDLMVPGGASLSLYFAAARASYPYLLPAYVLNDSWNWGVSTKRKEARTKAVVEAIERYSCGRGDNLKTIQETYARLGTLAIHPSQLGAYDPTPPYSLESFSETEQYLWCEAKGVYHEDSRWVLHDYVVYPLDSSLLGRNSLYYASSSGTAAHLTKRQALHGALAELCEREAMLITWYNRLPPPRVEERTLPPHVQRRIVALESQGYRVYVVDLTMDLLPTAGVIALGEGQQRAFTFGMSSSPHFGKGVDKALTEVEIMLLLEGERDNKIPALVEVRSPQDHGTYYMDPNHLDEVRFLFESPPAIIPMPSRRQSIRGAFDAAGLVPYYVNVTCQEVQNTDFPLTVVRALVPGMVPITFGYGLHHLGMDRLFSVPVKVGKRTSPIERSRVDTESIHPFC